MNRDTRPLILGVIVLVLFIAMTLYAMMIAEPRIGNFH
jgi:hypothetical protein